MSLTRKARPQAGALAGRQSLLDLLIFFLGLLLADLLVDVPERAFAGRIVDDGPEMFLQRLREFQRGRSVFRVHLQERAENLMIKDFHQLSRFGFRCLMSRS